MVCVGYQYCNTESQFIGISDKLLTMGGLIILSPNCPQLILTQFSTELVLDNYQLESNTLSLTNDEAL